MMYSDKKCTICGKKFAPKHPRESFCGEACRIQGRGAAAVKYERRLELEKAKGTDERFAPRFCEICDKIFKPRRNAREVRCFACTREDKITRDIAAGKKLDAPGVGGRDSAVLRPSVK